MNISVRAERFHSDTDGVMPFDPEQQVAYLLRRAHQRASALFHNNTLETGLTPPQFWVLHKLYVTGEVSQNCLGRRIGIDAATMQGIVQRLLRRGLISRVPDPEDRRRVRLSLTGAGVSMVESCMETAQRANRDALQPLNARERRTLVQLLRRLG